MALLPVQPFIKLVQNKMPLLTVFLTQWSLAPEVVSSAILPWQNLLTRLQGAAAPVPQSGVLADLVLGPMKYHAQFIDDIAQAGLSMGSPASAAAGSTART